MIYLGRNPVGLLAQLPKWRLINSVDVSEFHNYDTFTAFANSASMSDIISSLSDGDYRIEFVNNTNNTRAGQWITFTMLQNGEYDAATVSVMRVGESSPRSGAAYGINVYEGATINIYSSTMNEGGGA